MSPVSTFWQVHRDSIVTNDSIQSPVSFSMSPDVNAGAVAVNCSDPEAPRIPMIVNLLVEVAAHHI